MYILNRQFARKIMDSPQHKLYTKFAKFKEKKLYDLFRKVSREICNHAKKVPRKSKDRCTYI